MKKGNSQKITLSNTISLEDSESFDDLIDSSLDSEIGSDESSDNGLIEENVAKNTRIEEISLDSNESSSDSCKKKNVCPFEDERMNVYTDVNQKMIEIFNDFVSDTKLTIANLSTVAQNEAYIKARWCSKAMAAKIHTKKLKAEYAELKEKITEMVSSKAKSESFLTKRTSIDKIVGNDANLKSIAKKIEEAQLLEELYKEYYNDIIKGLGFQIRNSIDTLNFERGI